MNLCSNACDAMAEQGEGILEIRLQKDEKGPDPLPGHTDTGPVVLWTKLEVQDHGPGMDEETREKVFENGLEVV